MIEKYTYNTPKMWTRLGNFEKKILKTCLVRALFCVTLPRYFSTCEKCYCKRTSVVCPLLCHTASVLFTLNKVLLQTDIHIRDYIIWRLHHLIQNDQKLKGMVCGILSDLAHLIDVCQPSFEWISRHQTDIYLWYSYHLDSKPPYTYITFQVNVVVVVEVVNLGLMLASLEASDVWIYEIYTLTR